MKARVIGACVYTQVLCSLASNEEKEDDYEKEKKKSVGRGVTHCCRASREKEGLGALSCSCRAAMG